MEQLYGHDLSVTAKVEDQPRYRFFALGDRTVPQDKSEGVGFALVSDRYPSVNPFGRFGRVPNFGFK